MSRARDTANTQDNVGGSVAPYTAGKNALINGGFDIWQRGTSFSIVADTTYATDRYYFNRGGTLTLTKRSVGSYNPPSGIYSYAELANATAANPFIQISQTIETLNAQSLIGKVVTLSFYARANANTDKSKSLTYGLTGSTTVDARWDAIISGASTTSTIPYGTTSSDWQRLTITATIPAGVSTVGFTAYQAPSGGLAVGDGFQITGVQIELGSVATPFARAGGSIGGELALCQRYYFRTTSSANIYTVFQMGASISSTQARYLINYPVTMRTVPSAVDYSTLGVAEAGASIIVPTGVALDAANTVLVTVASGLTQYRSNFLYSNNSTSAYIGFSAEL